MHFKKLFTYAASRQILTITFAYIGVEMAVASAIISGILVFLLFRFKNIVYWIFFAALLGFFSFEYIKRTQKEGQKWPKYAVLIADILTALFIFKGVWRWIVPILILFLFIPVFKHKP